VPGELDQLADAIDRLRRLNADIRDTADPGKKRVLSERQSSVRARTAAAAGDEDAKELLRALEV